MTKLIIRDILDFIFYNYSQRCSTGEGLGGDVPVAGLATKDPISLSQITEAWSEIQQLMG